MKGECLTFDMEPDEDLKIAIERYSNKRLNYFRRVFEVIHQKKDGKNVIIDSIIVGKMYSKMKEIGISSEIKEIMEQCKNQIKDYYQQAFGEKWWRSFLDII